MSELSQYTNILMEIRSEIREGRYRAVLAANKEFITRYWNIGNIILKHQNIEGWGSKIIDRLAKDLASEFPDLKGFSARNLKYMRKFAEEYKEIEFVQEVLAQITWYHNITLLEKVENTKERTWYIQKVIENGWSRDVMVHQIETNLYQRQAVAEKTTNFKSLMPANQSELAAETLKDPYIFDFISFREGMDERDIERQLVQKITKFLLELGTGFAFIGNQYHLEVGGEDFYIDLLFYHTKLRCYVVIELKTGKFKPEYAGKLNFYLSAVDNKLKTDHDNPSIGIILCKEKNKLVAEYALKDMTKPMGVSEYKLLQEIPEELKSSLPTIEEIEENFTSLAGGETNE
ncbi:PDDEXK nuclease domain-containing protein [Acetivibrio cellulolyticus]|uniref:PDDEXK nuclease domain-containing protein n=1 Tax=Acetivibrio cellulolyticus TaxID=35830 RepID=UPI0001E2EB82|nr:PDDEXK nuclease domain-containing protein [Acetivibrio cellulolyticus]